MARLARNGVCVSVSVRILTPTAFYRHVGFVQGHHTETRLGGAPRMYLTPHGDETDQSDTGTGFDPR